MRSRLRDLFIGGGPIGPLLPAENMFSKVAAVGVLPSAGELEAEAALGILFRPRLKPVCVALGELLPLGLSLVGVPARRSGFMAGMSGAVLGAPPLGRVACEECGRPTRGTLLVEEMKVGSEIMFLLTVIRRGRDDVVVVLLLVAMLVLELFTGMMGVERPLLNMSGVERPFVVAAFEGAEGGAGSGECGGKVDVAGDGCTLLGSGPAVRNGEGMLFALVARAGLCNGIRGDGRGG